MMHPAEGAPGQWGGRRRPHDPNQAACPNPIPHPLQSAMLLIRAISPLGV